MFEAMLVIIVVLGPDTYQDVVVKVPNVQSCPDALKIGKKVVESEFPKGSRFIMVCEKLRPSGEVSV